MLEDRIGDLMKKVFTILLMLLLLPLMVNASGSNIELKDISLNEKSSNVEEVTPASIVDGKIKLDFKMYEVGDYIEYKVKVKNTTSELLELDKSSLLASVNYIKYSVDINTLNSGEEKEILLRITYQNKVADGDYFSAKYINQDKIPLKYISPSMINPPTSNNLLIIVLVSLFLVGTIVLDYKKATSKIMILILGISLIPFTTSALTEEIIIEPNIMIRKVKPTACTYSGSLVQGAEFTEGQYTYRYKQEKSPGTGWYDITSDGWGVALTDKSSTDDATSTLCSTINDKPIVSTRNMFMNSNTSKIDISSFDTSNVVNMSYMFAVLSNVVELDVSSLDTSNVIYMNEMFNASNALTSLDLSTFDTSKVTDMKAMFFGCSSLTSLDFSRADTSKVTDTDQMFNSCSSLTTAYGRSQADCDKFNNSIDKPSNVNFVIK